MKQMEKMEEDKTGTEQHRKLQALHYRCRGASSDAGRGRKKPGVSPPRIAFLAFKLSLFTSTAVRIRALNLIFKMGKENSAAAVRCSLLRARS